MYVLTYLRLPWTYSTLFKPTSKWKFLLENKHVYMQIKIVTGHQVQGEYFVAWGISVTLASFSLLLCCITSPWGIIRPNTHRCYWKRHGLFFSGKNVKAKGRMGTSSEWLLLPKSQIISRGYSEIGYFKCL